MTLQEAYKLFSESLGGVGQGSNPEEILKKAQNIELIVTFHKNEKGVYNIYMDDPDLITDLKTFFDQEGFKEPFEIKEYTGFGKEPSRAVEEIPANEFNPYTLKRHSPTDKYTDLNWHR